MHDGKVGLGGFQPLFGKNIAVLQAHIVAAVGEALLLNTGHIEYVEHRHYKVQVGSLGVFHGVFHYDALFDITRQSELVGRNENKCDISVSRKGGNERMNRSAEFKVSAQSYGQTVQAPLLSLDGKEVGQSLRRMVVAAVAGVYYRHIGFHGGYKRRAFTGMAHCNNIGIGAYNLDGVGDAFSLYRRA